MTRRLHTTPRSKASMSRKKRQALTRSEVMARVRGRDTSPEIRVRRALWRAGLRYRLQARELSGRPDIVFRQAKVAIFVHGCFWHRHPECEHARMPKSRQDFWEGKLAGNVTRDARNRAELIAAGWTVLTIWECETRRPHLLSDVVVEVTRLLESQITQPTPPPSLAPQ